MYNSAEAPQPPTMRRTRLPCLLPRALSNEQRCLALAKRDSVHNDAEIFLSLCGCDIGARLSRRCRLRLGYLELDAAARDDARGRPAGRLSRRSRVGPT